MSLGGLDAGAAAREITDTVGSDGAISLSDINKFMGVDGTDQASRSIAATVSKDWSSWTGSSDGTLDTSQLTDAIQNLAKNQPNA